MKEVNETSHTLLQRACNPNDQDAWAEFFGHYKRFIYYILHQVHVPKDEIEDVAQKILVTLTANLPRYDRNRAKFRSWLSSVIRNAASTHLRQLRVRESRFPLNLDDLDLHSAASLDESSLDQLIENEWTTYISNLAMERIRETFHGKAIEVFELGLDGQSAEEISRKTGLAVASVYTLRKRVKKRLFLEVRAITADLEP